MKDMVAGVVPQHSGATYTARDAAAAATLEGDGWHLETVVMEITMKIARYRDRMRYSRLTISLPHPLYPYAGGG